MILPGSSYVIVLLPSIVLHFSKLLHSLFHFSTSWPRQQLYHTLLFGHPSSSRETTTLLQASHEYLLNIKSEDRTRHLMQIYTSRLCVVIVPRSCHEGKHFRNSPKVQFPACTLCPDELAKDMNHIHVL